MEGNVVGHGEDEERNTTVALSDAAAVARTVTTTAPPSLARMKTAATPSVSLTMPKTTATRSTTAPTGVKAVGRSPHRRRGYPDGGDSCIVTLGAHDDGGDCVDVSHVANQKRIAVLEDVSVPTNSTVTLSGAAAVDAMAATCASPFTMCTTPASTALASMTLSTRRRTPSASAPTKSVSRWSHSASPPQSPRWRRQLRRRPMRAR